MANPSQIQTSISQQIAKLHQLQELLSQITDPEAFALARKLVNEPEQTAAPGSFHFRSVLLQTAYQCVQAMDESKEFVARGLIEKMVAAGYEFTGNPTISIQPALQAFIREKIIDIATRGAGRRATVYKRLAPASGKEENRTTGYKN